MRHFRRRCQGLSLKGGLLYAGVNGNPTTQGRTLNGAAPRGGFAWSLTDRTVIRGGYGFYRAPTQYPGLGEAAIGSKGYTATTTFLASTDGGLTPANTLSNPFPSGITPAQGNSLGLATGGGGVIAFADQNAEPGFVQQYSVDLQHQLPGGNMITIGYSGSRSERLTVGGTTDATVNINQLDPKYLVLGSALLAQLPNPFFGNSAFGNLSVSPTISQGQLLRPFR
jgi:trimeric autotransporter adhesin